jgi:hypothetical protein
MQSTQYDHRHALATKNFTSSERLLKDEKDIEYSGWHQLDRQIRAISCQSAWKRAQVEG